MNFYLLFILLYKYVYAYIVCMYIYTLTRICIYLFIFQAVEQLNLKTKNFKDLLTDEPFTRNDIITIQVRYSNIRFFFTPSSFCKLFSFMLCYFYSTFVSVFVTDERSCQIILSHNYCVLVHIMVFVYKDLIYYTE